MTDAALISCCNEALGECAKETIEDLDEGSLESAECARFAPGLLAEVADWTTWPSRIVRVTLAPVTNDRTAEWLYAFAQPSDMAKQIAIFDGSESAAVGLPPFGYGTYPIRSSAPIPFIIEGGVIYTNVETSVLAYTSNNLRAGDLSPKMRRAFVLELAKRICLPLAKDAKLAAGLASAALEAKMEAIADAENKTERMEPDYISAAEWARAGEGV